MMDEENILKNRKEATNKTKVETKNIATTKTKLYSPKLWPWLWQALFDWLIIIMCFIIANHLSHPLAWFVAIIVIGTRQHALSVLGHDGGHRLICKNRLLNDTLSCVLCFWPIGVEMSGYKKFHFLHHRNLGTKDDPELIHKNQLKQWTVPFKPFRLITYLITDFLGGALPHIVMLYYLTKPSKLSYFFMRPFAFIGSFILLFILLDAVWIPLVWFGALYTSFWVAFRLRIWTEHVGTNGTHKLSPSWFEKIIFLPHNVWCHDAHHKYPATPFWALPLLQDKEVVPKSAWKLFLSLS